MSTRYAHLWLSLRWLSCVWLEPWEWAGTPDSLVSLPGALWKSPWSEERARGTGSVLLESVLPTLRPRKGSSSSSRAVGRASSGPKHLHNTGNHNVQKY